MKQQILERVREAAKKYRYLLIIVAAGILLLLLPTGSMQSAQAPAQSESCDVFELADLERRMESVLERMSGVGKTEVVLTLGSTMGTVYQTDVRSENYDGSQSFESKTVLMNTGSGVQSAAITSRMYPTFRGALVVCEGGGSASVRLEVTRAVSALTGLSSDRITVAHLEAR